MAHIALIDDDLTEAMVLEGMLAHGEAGHTLTHFTTVEAFPAHPENVHFDVVFLDRRIPPHVDFDTSLPVLAAARFPGRVIPISAADIQTLNPHGLKVAAPVLKSELLTPEAVSRVINQVLADNQ